VVVEREINKISEEFNIDEIESHLINNVISKPKEFSESFRRNTYFMKSRYVLAGQTTNFSFRFIPRKITSFKKISLTLVSHTAYILNINGA